MDVYVSLSTIPSRFPNIKPCIESILSQTYNPKRIYINVCKKYKRFPDENIHDDDIDRIMDSIEFKDKNKVIFLKHDNDFGPGTKFVGPLFSLDLSDGILVIVDDDRKYKDDFIENIVNRYDNSHQVFTNKNGYLRINNKKFILIKGYDGVAFNINSININKLKKFIDIVFTCNAAFYHDDMWISIFVHMSNLSVKDIRYCKATSQCYNNSSNSLIDENDFNRPYVTRSFSQFCTQKYKQLEEIFI